jgi:hypothetical protein
MYLQLTASLDISYPKLHVRYVANLSYLSQQYAKCREDRTGKVQWEIHICVTHFARYHIDR